MTGIGATAARYRAVVTHLRRRPTRYRLRHRTGYWLVDVDDLPRPRWPLSLLARFDVADHLGDPEATIRANIEDFLRDNGIDPPLGAITMLCHARALGHVFNPLTVYWCHEPDGRLAAVVAEVHNTYRQRHRYLLRPDADGEFAADKVFHVSPFFPVEGRYRLRLPEPGRRLGLSIEYLIDDEPHFGAVVVGHRLAASGAGLLWDALRHPFDTWRTSAAIRWHGIRLYLRGLPIRPRPDKPTRPRVTR